MNSGVVSSITAKTLLVFALFLSIGAEINSQAEDITVFGYQDQTAVYQQGYKQGIVHADGRMLTCAVYEFISFFDQHTARVMQDGKWGLINDAGAVLLEPKYSYISLFYDSFGYGERPLAYATKNGLYGLVDLDGSIILEPTFRDERPISVFDYYVGDRIAVRNDGLWGLVDLEGNILVYPAYESYQEVPGTVDLIAMAEAIYEELPELSEDVINAHPGMDLNDATLYDGYATASVNGKWGFMDESGAWLFPPQFDEATTFFQGVAYACVYPEGVAEEDKISSWLASDLITHDAKGKIKDIQKLLRGAAWWELHTDGSKEPAELDGLDAYPFFRKGITMCTISSSRNFGVMQQHVFFNAYGDVMRILVTDTFESYEQTGDINFNDIWDMQW